MQFRLAVSDRGGLGISWDEETPPMYENVPEAPPHYAGIQCGDISEFLPPDYEHSC